MPEIHEDRVAAHWGADFAAYCEVCCEGVGRCFQGLGSLEGRER